MPSVGTVIGLQGFIEKHVLRTDSCDVLENCTLGIDAKNYIRTVYLRDSIKSSLSSALGGIPATFKEEVENDLTLFKKAKINCVFVFDGMDVSLFNSRDEKTMTIDPLFSKRRAAWDAWAKLAEKGRSADAKEREQLLHHVREAFSAATSLAPNIELCLMDIINSKPNDEANFIVAPVCAKAQLAFFAKHAKPAFVDTVWSDPDILLYDIDQAIIDIDLREFKMKWLFKFDLRDHKNVVFGASNFHEAFTDACILAGGVYGCPVLPNLTESLASIGPVFSFERAFDLIRTYAHGVVVIREMCNDNREYLDKFCRTKAILTYMPVMANKGQVQTYSQKNIPNDLAMVVTPRLSNEIYTYISRRLVGTAMYDFLISDRLRVQPPLDGGESQEYRNLLNDMIPLRVTALSLLAGHSNRFFHHKHLTITYWHQPDAQNDLPAYHVYNIAEGPYGRTRTWHVTQGIINSIAKSIDIRGLILALRGDHPKRTIIKKEEHNPLTSTTEVYANTLWRYMQLRDYVNEDHTLDSWGVALSNGLECLSENVHNDLYEPLWLALECFRFKVLHHEDFSVRYSGGPMHGSDDDKKHIRYICRVACMTELTTTPYPWEGPVSKAFLAFNSMVMEVSRNLRNLIEMVLLGMCVHGDVDRTQKAVPTMEWTRRGLMLPFGRNVNTSLAIFMRCKIEEMMCQKRNEKISTGKELNLVDAGNFENLNADVADEVTRFFALWDAFVVTVRSLRDDVTFFDGTKIKDEVAKIVKTHTWLQEFRD